MTTHPPITLVTGATDGIGQQTALELARSGHHVILHGRNPRKLEETEDSIASEVDGARLDRVVADFAELAQVRRMAEDLAERFDHLDVLLANAGVYMNEHRRSEDDIEMTMAVNHFAHFLLAHELLPLLESAPESARIVNVSSIAHTRGQIDLDDPTLAERDFDPYDAYAASKLANILFTVELARRLEARSSEVTVNALHPGVVSTKLLTEGFGMRGSDSLGEGAETSVFLADSDEVEGVSGAYFADQKRAKMNPVAGDAELTRRFYEISAEITGVEPL
jgi:NAD(P)-dependent dehydrogenase (short-subunit alcohol dehydrogenase family)